MSGIYISGMEMPKNDKYKRIILCDDGDVLAEDNYVKIGTFVSVPKHGSLKDYDSIYAEYKKWFDNAEYRNYESMFFALWNAFNHARIIIPSGR